MIPGWKYSEEVTSLGPSDMRFFKQGLLDTLWDQNEQGLNLCQTESAGIQLIAKVNIILSIKMSKDLIKLPGNSDEK